ncbi:MAG: 3-hydroxyacyl-CoA dehydrogenase family protein, partial [Rhodovarius sp.]|nr:3-hydroxyacyl-CoA dehydrogenase family protein [Rhodovarius sp.]
LNRLQAALVAEAFRLVRAGVMSVEDVDACVRDGLGLRWVLMGPFETCDLNAPGGFADYVARYGPLFSALAEDMQGCDFDAPTVAAVDAARRAQLPPAQIAARSAWRDRALMALLRQRGEIAGGS